MYGVSVIDAMDFVVFAHGIRAALLRSFIIGTLQGGGGECICQYLPSVYPLDNPFQYFTLSFLYGQEGQEWRFLGLTVHQKRLVAGRRTLVPQ